MFAYIIRRLAYAIPILIGINLLTFYLFFVVNSPDDMARMHLGMKRVTPEAIEKWKADHGYDKPLLFNEAEGGTGQLTDTIFFEKSVRLFAFDFGYSDDGRDISFDIGQRMLPSLAIAVPSLLIGLLVNITFALLMAFFRGTYIDVSGVILCVVLMSISGMFYIIGGQYLLAKLFRLMPISGFESGVDAIKFIILAVVIGVVSGIGSGSRWYRTFFLEEAGKDYIRTARAKGLAESLVLFRHILRNALIPIVTGVVVILPLLFMGSLLLESFFAVPGLGSYTIDAINNQDFAIVRVMVFLGSVLYIIGLILVDITYTIVDPRVHRCPDLSAHVRGCRLCPVCTSQAAPACTLAAGNPQSGSGGFHRHPAGIYCRRPAGFTALPAAAGKSRHYRGAALRRRGPECCRCAGRPPENAGREDLFRSLRHPPVRQGNHRTGRRHPGA
jgi:peptide/nickel transport system permease protein